MFTGIVEATGTVKNIQKEGKNIHFTIQSKISGELKIDQSVSHDGVCLTVTHVASGLHTVTAIDETLKRSTLGTWSAGSVVNLERCMKADGRFDGHIVQGHVDQTARVEKISEEAGSWLFDFHLDEPTPLLVEKGSVTVNGTSLTCFNTGTNGFRVAIIPYTYAHTNFYKLKSGDRVNIEFDILGKYVQNMLKTRGML